jgi:hypothetical protein
MKNRKSIWLLGTLALVLGLVLAGCDLFDDTETYTITFSLGEVSGIPPGSMSIDSGTAITLPEVTVPEGKTFLGWRSANSLQSSSGGWKTEFSAGESVTITAANTFTVRWVDKKYAQEGVYISLISFAGNATILGSPTNFVFLDSTGKSSLSSILTSSYRKASAPGTALFYGVHKGLANLTANESEFLTDISSVNLITFTDGLDNGSFGASNSAPIEGKSGVASGAYASYVRDEIGSRKINGMPITAYSVGIKTEDADDEMQFNATLVNIASTSTNAKKIIDFTELEGVFTGIADTLTFAFHFSMTTTQNDPGTIVRMTFDVTGTTPADAALSSKYIEGILGYADSVWTLANVAYGGGIASDTASGATIIGTASGSNVRFLFRNISGYDPADATVQQWTKPSAGSSAWQRNSEYNATGSTSTSPVLIQLALDASTSLEDSHITQIRTAATNFINTLYSRVYGSSN